MSPAQHGAHCSIMGCCFKRPMKNTPPEQQERRWLLVIFPCVLWNVARKRGRINISLNSSAFSQIFGTVLYFNSACWHHGDSKKIKSSFSCRSPPPLIHPLYELIYYSLFYLIQGAMNCLPYFIMLNLLFSDMFAKLSKITVFSCQCL